PYATLFRSVVDRCHGNVDGGRCRPCSIAVLSPLGQAGAAVPVLCWGEGQLVAGDAGCAMSSVRRSDDLEDGRYRRVNVGRGQGDLASSVLGGGEGLRLSNGCVVDRCHGDVDGGRCRPCSIAVLSPVGQAGAAVPVLCWGE